MGTKITNIASNKFRCYDNGGATYDRFTIVFTKKINEEFIYIGSSENPFSPIGIYQHGFSDYLIDKPRYKHLGNKITFTDLPIEVKKAIMSDYNNLLN